MNLGTTQYAFLQSHATVLTNRVREARASERGEGVISSALAVLIMAFLAAAMWLAYKGLFEKAAKSTDTNLDKIGQ